MSEVIGQADDEGQFRGDLINMPTKWVVYYFQNGASEKVLAQHNNLSEEE